MKFSPDSRYAKIIKVPSGDSSKTTMPASSSLPAARALGLLILIKGFIGIAVVVSFDYSDTLVALSSDYFYTALILGGRVETALASQA